MHRPAGSRHGPEPFPADYGHDLPYGSWCHVGVVNDGKHTTMYIDGRPVVRNPSTRNAGPSTLGLRWLLGGYEYGGRIDHSCAA